MHEVVPAGLRSLAETGSQAIRYSAIDSAGDVPTDRDANATQTTWKHRITYQFHRRIAQVIEKLFDEPSTDNYSIPLFGAM